MPKSAIDNSNYLNYIAIINSKEFGTHLTGRHSNIVLYPFSFHEFLKLKAPGLLQQNNPNSSIRAQLKGQFNQYVSLGGLPFQLTHNDPDYLSSLYENILYRDVITRYKITREQPIKSLAHYLASNIGKEVSFNNLKKLIHVASHTTVSDYCHYLQDSYLCYLLTVHHYSLQKQGQHPKKIYFNDTAMAAKIGFRHSEDYGRILENIVYLELRRRHKEIYFYKQKKECDFVVKTDHKITAVYQVTTSLENDTRKTREYSGLVEAMDTYSLSEGYILTEDTEGEECINVNEKEYTIKILPIWCWLLEN